MRLPTRKSEKIARLKNQDDQFLTPEAIERMKRDHDRLIHEERPRVAEEVRRTGEMGDFSENAAYQIAKGNLRRINNQILVLQDRIARAIVVTHGSDDGVVRIGSTIVLRSNGQTLTYRIVGSLETDPSRGYISHTSPLGSALIGHKIHEQIAINTNGHRTSYEILEIK